MSIENDLELFLIFGAYLGLLPQRQNNTFQTNTIKLCVCIIIICGFTIGFLFSSYNDIGLFWNAGLKNYVLSSVITKFVQFVVQNITVVYFILITSIFKRNKLIILFQYFDILDNYFKMQQNYIKIPYPRVAFWIANGFSAVIYTYTGIMYYFQLPSFPYQTLIDLFGKHLFTSIVSFIIMLLWIALKRARVVNMIIMEIGRRRFQIEMDDFLKSVDYFYDIIELMNDVFGGTLFLITIHMIFFLLRLIRTFVLTYGDITNIRILQLSLACFHVWIQVVIVATLCQKILDEGQKMIVLSYNATFYYKNVPTMREKCVFLAQQATVRCPQFSAAGFFNIDYSMLFLFTNLITTYVIVIIQFSQYEI